VPGVFVCLACCLRDGFIGARGAKPDEISADLCLASSVLAQYRLVEEKPLVHHKTAAGFLSVLRARGGDVLES